MSIYDILGKLSQVADVIEIPVIEESVKPIALAMGI